VNLRHLGSERDDRSVFPARLASEATGLFLEDIGIA
jgi:hypothetical protein